MENKIFCDPIVTYYHKLTVDLINFMVPQIPKSYGVKKLDSWTQRFVDNNSNNFVQFSLMKIRTGLLSPF